MKNILTFLTPFFINRIKLVNEHAERGKKIRELEKRISQLQQTIDKQKVLIRVKIEKP